MATATLDPITGLATSNTQDPLTGSVTSNPITPEALKSPVPIISVNPPVDDTNHTGIIASATQSVADSYKTANDQYTAALKAFTDGGGQITADMNLFKDKTKDTQAANETAGVNTALDEVNRYTTQLADLNGQASALNREAAAIPIQTQQNNLGTGATDQGVAPQTAGALRSNALRALSIAQQSDIVSAALTGSNVRLQAAKEKAQQIIDLKYKPLEQDLAIRTKQYELNKDTLSLIDKKRTEALGIALDKEKQDLAEKKDLDTKISAIQLEAAKNGANTDIIAGIGGAKTITEAIKAAGSSLASPNTEIVKLGDNAVLIDKTTGKILKSYGSTTPGNGSGILVPSGSTPEVAALANLAPLVSGFSSVNAQKTFVSAINQLASKPGNEKAIAEKMAGTVIDNIQDTNTRKLVSGDFAMAQQLTRLQGLLDDYNAQGGKTNWITGKKEGGYQFTGQTSNPALAKIGVQIANQLDELARTRTGAVVSASEEASFNKMLPGIGKSPDLNTALTSGLKTSLMSNVETSLQYAITGDGLKVIKSTLPEVFGDYRSANPTVQLKQIYNSVPAMKTQIDQMQKEHPEWTASDIMQIINGK